MIKKILTVFAATLLLIGCGKATDEGNPQDSNQPEGITVKPQGDAQEDPSPFGISNPWVGTTFDKVKDITGFALPVEETFTLAGETYTAQTVSYATDQVVEVVYKSESGNEVTFRETYVPTDKDISGFYDNFTLNQDFSIGNNNWVNFKGTVEGISVVSWTDQLHTYSLTSAKPIPASDVHDFLNNYLIPTIEKNVASEITATEESAEPATNETPAEATEEQVPTAEEITPVAEEQPENAG